MAHRLDRVECREVGEVSRSDLRQRVVKCSAERRRVWVLTQLLQMVQQHLARIVGVVQQEMDPGPGLLVVGSLHLDDVLQGLQTVEVRFPIVGDGDAELPRVLAIDGVGRVSRNLEVFGQAFIQPQRDILELQFNMSFVIRQTIRRPGMMELNPSVDYSDPYNIRFGNPYLLPALINNLDFNLSYVKNKFSINGSMGYNRISNVFNSIRTLVDSGKTQITFQNISDQEEYLVSFWTGCNLSRNFRVSISGGYNYNKYGEREKQLYKYVDAGGFYTTFNYSYTPDNLTIIEANNRYNSFANPQGKARSNVTMSISVLRKFYNKRLMVGVSAIDPFGLERYQGYSAGSNFTIESYSVTNTQNFRLSLSYQLSRTLIKSKLTDKDKTDALNKLDRK